jgi:hypothetical protein
MSLAGPHAGGTLIIHSPDIIFCLDGGGAGTGSPDLCTASGDLPLLDCESAVINGSGEFVADFLAVYAAFPQTSSPRLLGLTMGISYDESAIFILDSQACGDFELPNSNWPSSGEGTAITWVAPQTDHLVPVYVFAAYEYYGLDVSFDLGQHPIHGSWFADDSVPSVLDPVADFGRFGFNGNPGYLPCPEAGDPVGACCIDLDCLCIIATRQECDAEGGDYLGDNTDCDAVVCECFPGACCLSDGECFDTTLAGCDQVGGTWLGEFTLCTPTSCEPVPTLDSSWGRIKSNYR